MGTRDQHLTSGGKRKGAGILVGWNESRNSQRRCLSQVVRSVVAWCRVHRVLLVRWLRVEDVLMVVSFLNLTLCFYYSNQNFRIHRPVSFKASQARFGRQ